MAYPKHLLPTTVVGSYPQPDWLVNRAALEKHGVPRTHALDIWRIPEPLLEQAQDDGTILAIRDMERAGIDIITDGEIRRESYSNRFALALEGIDAEHPGEVRSQAGRITPVPRVVGRIRRRDPVELRDVEFCCARPTTQPRSRCRVRSPCRSRCRNEFYEDEEEMAMDYAAAVNEELRDLKATGVDVVQLDEPWVRTAPDKAERYGVRAINRALEGVAGPTVIHLCFGYAHVVSNKPSGYAFLSSSPTRRRSRSRSRLRSRTSTSACWPTCPASGSCLACSTWATSLWNRPSRLPHASGADCNMSTRNG